MGGKDRKVLGRWGEAAAAAALRRLGGEVVAAGWHCRFGEIDLIVRRGRYLCFVEVKLRGDGSFATAREAVDQHKQSRLVTAAQLYLAGHPTALQPRFDVVEVYAPQGMATQNPEIHIWENAFSVDS